MVGFTPVEEVERILMESLEMAEKEERDFFREEWVEEPRATTSMEDLVVVVVVKELQQEVAAEGTLVEAVDVNSQAAVGEGEDLITPEQISKMTVVSTQLAMVKWPLHCCKKTEPLSARYTGYQARFSARR